MKTQTFAVLFQLLKHLERTQDFVNKISYYSLDNATVNLSSCLCLNILLSSFNTFLLPKYSSGSVPMIQKLPLIAADCGAMQSSTIFSKKL